MPLLPLFLFDVMAGAPKAISYCEVILSMEATHGRANMFLTTWDIIPLWDYPLQT